MAVHAVVIMCHAWYFWCEAFPSERPWTWSSKQRVPTAIPEMVALTRGKLTPLEHPQQFCDTSRVPPWPSIYVRLETSQSIRIDLLFKMTNINSFFLKAQQMFTKSMSTLFQI